MNNPHLQARAMNTFTFKGVILIHVLSRAVQYKECKAEGVALEYNEVESILSCVFYVFCNTCSDITERYELQAQKRT